MSENKALFYKSSLKFLKAWNRVEILLFFSLKPTGSLSRSHVPAANQTVARFIVKVKQGD